MKTEQNVKGRVRFSRKIFEEKKIAEEHYSDDNGIPLEDDLLNETPEYTREDELTEDLKKEQEEDFNEEGQ